MGDEGPEFADRRGRHPYGWDEVGRQQAGELDSVAAIGLDAGRGDELDAERVGDGDRGDQRHKLIVQQPGIGAGFEHDGIRLGQVVLGPARKGDEAKAARREDHGLLGIDGTDDQLVPVDVEGDEPGGRARRDCRWHTSLLLIRPATDRLDG